jgi:hypothetical protein
VAYQSLQVKENISIYLKLKQKVMYNLYHIAEFLKSYASKKIEKSKSSKFYLYKIKFSVWERHWFLESIEIYTEKYQIFQYVQAVAGMNIIKFFSSVQQGKSNGPCSVTKS